MTLPNNDRFREHEQFQAKMLDIIRPYTDLKHLPDIRISINKVIFYIDFKTTSNVEKNSHDTYFGLLYDGEKVALVYNNRPSEKLPDGDVLAGWINELVWAGPYPPSIRSRSGDPYYRISGGIPLVEFLVGIK